MTEEEFISGLTAGVKRTREFMSRLTEYQGGASKTEYLITSDIAREFLDRGHMVRVEVLNRHLCSLLTAEKPKDAKKALGRKRTDVAIGEQQVFLNALVEIKIRITSIKGIKKDIDKIVETIRFMKPDVQKKILAASVFQVHISATKNNKRRERVQFVAALNELENKLGQDLSIPGQEYEDFSFDLKSLQEGNSEGIVDYSTAEQPDGSRAIDQDGHVTRYYAVIIKHTLYGKKQSSQDAH